MKFKGDWEKINKEIFKLEVEHNFKGPLHFTDYSNLKSILDSGFLSSREGCNKSNIEFLNGAESTVIDKTSKNVKKCVRFYYKELSLTMYNNEGIKINNQAPHIPIPVYLLFDDEIIYHEDAVYSDGCAGSDYTSFGKSSRFFSGIKWDIVFSRGSIPYEWPDNIRYRTKRIRQAELLMENPVDLKYLKKIIFRSKCDYKRAVNDFGELDLFEVNSNMFNCNNEFVKDYEILYNEKDNNIIFNINLNIKNFNCYKYSYSVVDDKDEYIEVEHEIIENNSNIKILSFKLNGYEEKWDKFVFYINNIECIIENLKDIKNKQIGEQVIEC